VSYRELNVNVPRIEANSPIWVGRGISGALADLIDLSRYSRIIVVCDSGAGAIASLINRSLKNTEQDLITLQGGEGCKDFDHLRQLWERFAALKLDRKALVVGVGGGALSDLLGFATGTYMRGIDLIAVPTTLLAQVDAGIGGKCGINLAGVKNLVGVIKQPRGILIDTDNLSSLPARDLRSGFAEIVKHGLIADPNYFAHVTSRPYSEWSSDQLCEIIYRSCEIKRDIVQADELELGQRKALNFGHTIGHAIEAHCIKSDTSIITHGEAVAIGMRAACEISNSVGLLSDAALEQSIKGLSAVNLPTKLSTPISAELLLSFIALDKKSVGGLPRWTLLSAIGKVTWDQKVELDVIKKAIESIQP
jgi:3-dehydroquinate synthase